jgi:hypothetical protein
MRITSAAHLAFFHLINDTLFIFLAALLEFVEGLRHAGFAPSLLHLW